MYANEFHLSRECFLEHPLYEQVSLPPRFIAELMKTHKRAELFQIVTRWLPQLFFWDRASITFEHTQGYLSLVCVIGNDAIPTNIPLPIDFTLAGRAYKTQTLITSHSLSSSEEQDCRMLVEGGLRTCMDAPITHKQHCFGTLNVAKREGAFSQEQAIRLFCAASLLGLCFSLNKETLLSGLIS